MQLILHLHHIDDGSIRVGLFHTPVIPAAGVLKEMHALIYRRNKNPCSGFLHGQ